jgi:hypothetical protein
MPKAVKRAKPAAKPARKTVKAPSKGRELSLDELGRVSGGARVAGAAASLKDTLL